MAKAKAAVVEVPVLKVGDQVTWQGMGPMTVIVAGPTHWEALNLTMRVQVETPEQFERVAWPQT